MGNRISQTPQGFVVMDPRWNRDALAPNTGGAADSDYTENTPRPGAFLPGSSAQLGVIELSNGQERGVEVCAQLGGRAGLAGASVIYRLDGDTLDTDWFGWDPPCQPAGFFAAFWSDVATRDTLDVATFPESQEPLIIMDGFARRWSHASQDWAPEVAIFTPPVTANTNALIIVPESERALVINGQGAASAFLIVVYASEDGGLTWQEGARAGGFTLTEGVGVTSNEATAAYQDGSIVYLQRSGATSTWFQYASADLGATWTAIALNGFTLGTGADLFAIPGGGFGLVYTEPGGDELQFRRIGSAFENIDDAAVIEIEAFSSGSTADGRTTGWIDPDGTIWAACAREDGSCLFLSVDNGDTWAACTYGLMDTQTGDTQLENWTATAAAGGVLLIGNHSADVSNETGSVSAIWAGGHSKTEAQPQRGAGSNLVQVARTRWAFGLAASEAMGIPPLLINESIVLAFNATWFPWDLPDDYQGGNPASQVWDHQDNIEGTLEAPGMMEIATIGDFGSYSLNNPITASATSDRISWFADFKCTADLGGVLEVVIDIQLADGTNDRTLRVLASTTGLRLVDRADGSTLATVTADVAAGVCIRGMVRRSGQIAVWWRPRGMRGDWRVFDVTSSLVNETAIPAADLDIQWGNVSVGTYTTEWYSFCVVITDDLTSNTFWTATKADAVVFRFGQLRGRWLSGLPFPVYGIGGTDQNFAHLAVKAGPLFAGDCQTAQPAYDFPIEALFPAVSPSPAQSWRSANAVEDVIIALDFDELTRLDSVWCWILAISNTNLRRIHFEGHSGAAWSPIGIYDGETDFTGLSFVRTGNIIRPDRTSTTSAGRFIQHNEFKAGYLNIDPTGSPKILKIESHSAGAWRSTAASPIDAAESTFRTSGDLSSVPASGSVNIRATGGVLITNPAEVYFDRFRLRIVAAENPVADDYFQIGSALPGALVAVGKRWQRGFSRALIPNTSTRTDARGTIRRRQEGPPARRWVQSWSTGVDLLPWRADINTDFHSAGPTRLPLVARGDVWHQLEGALVGSKGGEIPVIGIAQVPDTLGVTQTDRSKWIYGSLSGSVQANNIVGDEGVSEAVRVESLTIEELI